MSLPINEIFAELLDALQSNTRVILQAPPGAGKSTLLPLLLLKTGQFSPSKQILLLEPRRVAARQIAHYLASNLGEQVGQTVGLSMRGEHLASQSTVIRVVTDGVLLKMLQADPLLSGINLVLFDEFHERALQTDLALGLALDSQAINDELKLIIMSATLNLNTLSTALDAPVISSEGRQYPVSIQHVKSSLMPTEDEILSAIRLALSEQTGSILVFLAGVQQIARMAELLRDVIDDTTLLCRLYGGLDIKQQVAAIEPAPAGFRKVVLTTNIAQTSLTIEGIHAVVDSGIEKVVQYDPNSDAEKLISQPISKAAAIQRAGRAGRLGPGVCYRLGTLEQYERRRDFDVAEIERVDLAELLLELSVWGAQFEQIFWLSQPDKARVAVAAQKLRRLGFWQQRDYQLTALAGVFRDFSSSLRTSSLLNWVLDKSADLKRVAAQVAAYIDTDSTGHSGDLSRLWDSVWHSRSSQARSLEQRYCRQLKIDLNTPPASDTHLIAVMFSYVFPDRIAIHQGKQWKLSNGLGARFYSPDAEPKADIIVVTKMNGTAKGFIVEQYVSWSFAQLQRNRPDLLEERVETGWNNEKQAPFKSKRVWLGYALVKESPMAVDLSVSDWQNLWIDYLRTGQAKSIWATPDIEQLLNRISIANQFDDSASLPNWTADNIGDWIDAHRHLVSDALAKVRSVEQLTKLPWHTFLESGLEWSAKQLLDTLCPTHFVTPAGIKHKIEYAKDAAKVSVKLQEMFGQPTTPAIANGKMKLTVELLSPAKRPLQTTQDLAHFWQNAYHEVKKEMKGRYPKHPWPDDPVSTEATHKTKAQLKRS